MEEKNLGAGYSCTHGRIQGPVHTAHLHVHLLLCTLTHTDSLHAGLLLSFCSPLQRVGFLGSEGSIVTMMS